MWLGTEKNSQVQQQKIHTEAPINRFAESPLISPSKSMVLINHNDWKEIHKIPSTKCSDNYSKSETFSFLFFFFSHTTQQAGNKSYKTMPETHTTPATTTSYNSSQTQWATTTTKSTTHNHHRQKPQPITTNSSQRWQNPQPITTSNPQPKSVHRKPTPANPYPQPPYQQTKHTLHRATTDPPQTHADKPITTNP